MSQDTLNRRNFLQSLGLGMSLSSPALALCRLTPRQGEGPFYPEADWNRDNDLTRIRQGGPAAIGEKVHLSGIVQDPDCKPIDGALVEIWQAAASGKYNHSQDTSSLPLDPDFQYWGRTNADSRGRYAFTTIIPGHYPVGAGRYRPPHIHVKVHARGFTTLTTQVYFDPKTYDDPRLAALVERLNRLEGVPQSLMVRYRGAVGEKSGQFAFTLRPTT